MNNLKAERTLTAEELQGEFARIIRDEVVADYTGSLLGVDRAVKALASIALQSLSTQQPMGEVTHSPPDVDNRPFCDCHQEYGEGLIEALQWYGEQARLCRLIHSEGDAGRYALSADGGKRAKVALHPNQENGE